MTRPKSEKPKISPGFAARLKRLGPRDKIYAIVLLRTGDAAAPSGRRQSRAEREAAIEAMRASAGQALNELDGILERFDGQRFADAPDALGSIPVETTVAGIETLASSDWVKAIVEDQPIQLTLDIPENK
jgi:sorbitol-specific phosphotransferase system component IIA